MEEKQKSQLTGALTIGANRETAAAYLAMSVEELEKEIADDPALMVRVRQSEASAELTHMRNLYKAAEGEKHWRASVWWLESNNPEKYSRKASHVTTSDLRAFIEQICTDILSEVSQEKREEIIQKMERLMAHIESK